MTGFHQLMDFTWKHVIANFTFSLKDMQIILNESNVSVVDFMHCLKRGVWRGCACVCMCWVGRGGEEGNHLDDYGPNLLVRSDLVNRAESVRTQMNGFLSYDCV